MSLRVKYLGRKKFATDRFCKTGAVWYGEGDVQEIEDEEKANKLCKFFPSSFKIVKPGEIPKFEKLKEVIEEDDNPLKRIKIPETDGTEVRLVDASYQAVYKYVEENTGIHIPEGANKKELLNQVEQIERLKDELVRTPAAETKIEMRENLQDALTKPALSKKPPKKPAPKPDETLEAKGLALLGDIDL